MIKGLLTGIFSGFVLSTQFDLSNMEAFQRGLRQGFRESLLVSLGSTAGDAIYWVVMLLGHHQLLHNLQNNKIYVIIYAVFLIIMGYLSLLDMRQFEQRGSGRNNRLLVFIMNPFVAGFIMSVINPSTMLWSFVVTELFEKSFMPKDMIMSAEPHIFVGLIVGGILWAILLAFLSSKSKKLVSNWFLKAFIYANCLLFFITGVTIFIRAI